MLIDNDRLSKKEILTMKPNIQSTNECARGDYCCSPTFSRISNRIEQHNSINDNNHYSLYSLKFKRKTDDYIQSNLASGEPEQHDVCVSTSSATFIVSSSPSAHPLDMIVPHEDHKIHSNTDINLTQTNRTSNDYQQSLWFKQYWISISVIAGFFIIFIIIIIIGVIL